MKCLSFLSTQTISRLLLAILGSGMAVTAGPILLHPSAQTSLLLIQILLELGEFSVTVLRIFAA